MKEKLKKVKGILILLLLMVLSANSHLLMSVATDDNLQEREVQATAKIETNLEKYINYDIDGQKGELVQLGLDASIEYETEEDKIPLQATGIILNAPKIEETFPESVNIISKSTMLTNGSKNGKDYKYEYDKENGQVKIIVYNKKDDNGNIYSQIQENAKDSFSLILNYGENTYNTENIEKKLKFEGQLIELAANSQNIKFKANFEPEYTVSENKSSVISSNITSNKVYNGYIKSNIINENNYTTNYAEVFELNISKEQISDEIQIDFKNEFEKNQIATETDQVIYTSSAVNKEEAFKILGENGYIKAIDQEGNVIGEITNQTEADAKGICKINYTENHGKLKLVVSKPETVGNIKIQNNKQILSTMKDLNVEKIVQEDEIKCINKVEEQVEETNEETGETQTTTKTTDKEIYNNKASDSIELRDSSTKVKLNVNQTEWTNEKQNELEFELELCNNKAKYNLFSNFEATIQLPEETEKVILDKENLMYANGLEVENISYNQETKQITLKLAGTQTKYVAETLEKGTTLTIPAIVILQNNIEEKEIDLTAIYKNYNTYTKAQETGTATEKITLDNFTQELTSNDQNTDNQAQPLMRSGATLMSAPTTSGTTGTVQTAEGIELEVKAIRGDAEITEENPTVYEGEFIKYEITAKNTTSNKIDDVKIAATLPEGVKYGELVREDYEPEAESYYDFTKQLGTMELGSIEAGKTQSTYFEVQVNDLAEGENEKQIITGIKAFIGNALADECTLTHVVKDAEYKVYLGSDIYYYNEFRYHLTIKGNSEEDVNVKIKLPESVYVDNFIYKNSFDSNGDIKIESNVKVNIQILDGNVLSTKIKPGEYVLYFVVDKTKLDNSEIKTIVEVNEKYLSNENRMIIPCESVSISMDSNNKGEEIHYGEEINYEVNIKNTGRGNYKDNGLYYIQVNMVDYLPKQVQPIEIVYDNYEIIRDEETNEEKEIKKIENIREEISGIYYKEDDSQDNSINIPLIIPYGETITVKIKVKADMVESNTLIENKAIVSGRDTYSVEVNGRLVEYNSEIKSKLSNIINHTILPLNYDKENEEPGNTEESSNSGEPTEQEKTEEQSSENKYSISGYVWNDKNGDGKKQENEETLSGIQTYLMDTDGNVKNIATSGKDGRYTFSDIKEGNYIVIFRYNSDKYNITKYQVSGASETINSNVQKQNITIQGEEFVAGVSNEITVNKDISNINIGLIEIQNQKFDMKVESYINKVTVKTANGTTEKTYDNATLAKTEIKAKEVEGATVEVEYKIVITNNGNVDGTVNNVVDTLPDGFILNKEDNSDWIKNNDGTLINNSLSNKIIQTGNSIEITLNISKSMTENKMGTFNNKVSIEGISNKLELKDINIQNNSSKTELIISISTGGVIYLIITIFVITVILVLLNSKFNIFNKIKYRFLIVFIMLIGISLGFNYNTSKAINYSDYHLDETKLVYLTAGDQHNDSANTDRRRFDSIEDWAIIYQNLETNGNAKWTWLNSNWYLKYFDNGSSKGLYTVSDPSMTLEDIVDDIINNNGRKAKKIDVTSNLYRHWEELKQFIRESKYSSNYSYDAYDSYVCYIRYSTKFIYFQHDWRAFYLLYEGQSIDRQGDGTYRLSSTPVYFGNCINPEAGVSSTAVNITNLGINTEWIVDLNQYNQEYNAYIPTQYNWSATGNSDNDFASGRIYN